MQPFEKGWWGQLGYTYVANLYLVKIGQESKQFQNT